MIKDKIVVHNIDRNSPTSVTPSSLFDRGAFFTRFRSKINNLAVMAKGVFKFHNLFFVPTNLG